MSEHDAKLADLKAKVNAAHDAARALTPVAQNMWAGSIDLALDNVQFSIRWYEHEEAKRLSDEAARAAEGKKDNG